MNRYEEMERKGKICSKINLKKMNEKYKEILRKLT